MKKIIFREVTPEAVETDILFDYDGLSEVSGKNNALYIFGDRGYMPINKKEYDAISKQAENIADDFNALMGNDHYYFVNFKECLHYYGVKYSPVMVHRLKEWAKTFDNDIEGMAAYLTITTGEEWETYTVTGYCQGDYATALYCKGHYSEESLELYAGAVAGTVSEFCRIEENDTCYGFFVPDSVKWNTDELRTYLSKQWGDNEENITLELFDGYTQTANYMEA